MMSVCKPFGLCKLLTFDIVLSAMLPTQDITHANMISDVTEEELGSEHPKVRFSISLPHQEDEKPKANVEEVKKPQATSESKLPESEVQPQESKENPSTKDKASTKVKDPIRWFGILVPPALRTAQQTFTSAFEGPIPQLAAISRDLRNQEIEIGRVRKQIKKL